MGGKARQAKKIVDVVVSDVSLGAHYYEPFLGGGWIATEVAKRDVFDEMVLSDLHPDLVMMWSDALEGWVPPEDVPLDEYEELRSGPMSARRGFVGFACSFGAKWFGGYARGGGRNWAAEGSRSLVRKVEVLRDRDVRVECRDYMEISPRPRDVVYCDPPYANTTGYSPSLTFDHDQFWEWATSLSLAGVVVYVSEFSAPDNWVSIFDVDRVATVNASSVVSSEGLFRYE